MLYRSILRPLLFRLPPEAAHELALKTLASTVGSRLFRRIAARHYSRWPTLELRRFDLSFPNPVGVAAGFDKNGIAVEGLAALGFGFVEVGTVTHLPQPGNPRPRLFRLPLDRALINRQGFNNHGAAALAERFARHRPNCVLGINIGKSRAVDLEQATVDYLASFELVCQYADYVVVNVSSPNTPGLRELQRADTLENLLVALQNRNEELAGRINGTPVPLLVKIAPDLSVNEIEAIVKVAERVHLSGIIATNTTTNRGGLRTPNASVTDCGDGGLSGAPLSQRSTDIISSLFRLTKGRMTIIGVGGIFTAEDAWEKICAGASLVQVYTGFVYQGWEIAREINEGLARILRREGMKSIDEAIGMKSNAKGEGREAKE